MTSVLRRGPVILLVLCLGISATLLVTTAAKKAVLPKTLRTVQEEEARRARKMRYRVKEMFLVYRDAAFGPSAALAPNGDFLVSFTTTSDSYPEGRAVLLRSSDQGKTWGKPVVVAESRYDGGAIAPGPLAAMPDGTLFLGFIDQFLPKRENAPLGEKDPTLIFDYSKRVLVPLFKRSSDNGHTWSELQGFGPSVSGWQPYLSGRPLFLKDGSILLPYTYVEKQGETWRAGFLTSLDGAKTWSEPRTAAYTPREELNMPAPPGGVPGGWNDIFLVQRPNGDIIGIVNQDGDLGLRRQRFLVRSTDGGNSWDAPRPTDAFGKGGPLIPLSSGEMLMALGSINLADGGLVLSTANEIRRKLGGTASFAGLLISGDGGLTWQEDARFESPIPEGIPFDAPSIVPLAKGNILVVFMAMDETYTDPKGAGWVGGYFLVGNILEPVP